MSNVILRVKREDGSWAEIPALVGPEGPQGVSINDIVLKSQEGGVSTYLILLSDGSEKTFQVTDGAIITDVSLISTDVLIDTYKISISDGSFFNFKVTNGRGIKSIAKTSTNVLSDTYAISYNDNTTSTYTITNGRGIDYIEKDETIGLRDRYTIHYNDGSTSYYYVTNGEAGPAGSIGNRIYLSGLVDRVNDEEGYKRVKELKESKFDLSKFTVVGSPTITNDGILTNNFNNNSNYVSIPFSYTSNWRVKFHWKSPSSLGSSQFVLTSWDFSFIRIIINPSGVIGFRIFLSDTTSVTKNINFSFSPNTDYVVSIAKTSTGYTYGIKEVSANSYIEDSITSNLETNGKPLIFFANSDISDKGSIDLKQFSITVDSKEVFSGNKTGIDVIKPDNYEVVGSPTITDDGVASGFSTNSYLLTPSVSLTNDCVFEIDFNFAQDETAGVTPRICYGTIEILHDISNDRLGVNFYLNDNTTIGFSPSLNGVKNIKLIASCKNGNYNVIIINKNTSVEIYNITKTGTSIKTVSSPFYLGNTPSGNRQLTGSIDLNSFKIYVDGNLVYQPCLKIPYTESKTGSKIVDISYKLRVEDCYNQYGAGNYYLFSSATEQFALPMPDIYGLIENLDTKIINLDNKKVNRAGDTMTGSLVTPTPLFVYNNGVDISVTPSENIYTSMVAVDKNFKVTGYAQSGRNSDGSQSMEIGTMRTINGVNTSAAIGVGFDVNNVTYTYAPHPANKLDNSNKLATTNWVRNHCCITPATTESTASLDAPCYVIENYVNGTSWYRKYSDKYVEQGSSTNFPSVQTTYSLLIPFLDTNWHIFTEPFKLNNSNYGEGICIQDGKTSTSFVAHGYNASANHNVANASWVAFGQGI